MAEILYCLAWVGAAAYAIKTVTETPAPVKSLDTHLEEMHEERDRKVKIIKQYNPDYKWYMDDNDWRSDYEELKAKKEFELQRIRANL